MAELSTAPKPKRPLFKKRKVKPASNPAPNLAGLGDEPAAATNLDEEDDDGLELFKRSKDFFPVFLKDRDEELAAERQLSDCADRKRRKISPSPGRPSPQSDLYDVSDEEKERMRQRQDERPLTPPPTKNKNSFGSSGRRSGPRDSDKGKGKEIASPASLAATPSRRAPAMRANENSSIVISDSDDYYTPNTTANTRRFAASEDLEVPPSRDNPTNDKTAPIEIDDDIEEVTPATGPDEEDGEFAHFVIAARERRAKHKAAFDAAASNKKSKLVDERTVQIFITSRLPPPEMAPVIFKTVMRKKIQLLLDTVLSFSASKGRPLTDEESSGAFLVWKDRRLYGATTLMSLGIEPNSNGEFSKTGHGNVNDGVTIDGQLHFELFTEKIYAEYMQDVERQRQKDLYQTISDDEGGASQKQAAVRQGEAQRKEGENPAKIRICLKAKNFDQVKTSALADTEIGELVAAFRNVRKIPADKEIIIMFDGDKLAESDTVGHVGIEDRDAVDVLIR